MFSSLIFKVILLYFSKLVNLISFFSKSIEKTSNILEIICKHGKYYKIENIHLIKQKRIPDDIDKQKLNIIASIPYIKEKYAEDY